MHQNHWEGDGSGGGVKNTDALTPRYAPQKTTLLSFPNFELHMNGIIYMFLMTTFA